VATTLDDLLQHIEQTARQKGPPADTGDAIGALDHLGRALDDLVADGFAPEITDLRQNIIRSRARACHSARITIPPSGGQRPRRPISSDYYATN
jgi:hypothetical protein